MLQISRSRWARTLHDQLKLFKVRGIHPDFLYSIDPDKAHHNGDELVRLETLLAKRTSRLATKDELAGQHSISFWLPIDSKAGAARAAARDEPTIVVEDGRSGKLKEATSVPKCRTIACELTPLAGDAIVKKQLQMLFREVGLDNDFTLAEKADGDAAADLRSAVLEATHNWNEHVAQSGSLYTRGMTAITQLMKMGLMVVFETDVGVQHLITIPEDFMRPPTMRSPYQQQQQQAATAAAPMTPELQTFLAERNLEGFDFRMFGVHSNIERVVLALERLRGLYDAHRGTALRTNICLVITIQPGATMRLAADGCFVLPLSQDHRWVEFLFGCEQQVWRDVVQQHQEWRIASAPKLQEHRRKLKRVADILGCATVAVEAGCGAMCDPWHQSLLTRLLKEEVAIRKTIDKYKISSDIFRRRGRITFVERLLSATNPNKELHFRISCEGRVQFSASVTSPQLLRVLKDNLKAIESSIVRYDKVQSDLEFLSRSMPVDFSADTEWKRLEHDSALAGLEKFVSTIRSNRASIANLLRGAPRSRITTNATGTGSSAEQAGALRHHWVVSNRYEVTSSGVVFVPWDIDTASLELMLLGRT